MKALADLIYCVFGLPVIAAELINNRHWNLGWVGCKIVSTIILINLYGSVYFLSTISIGTAKQRILNPSSKYIQPLKDRCLAMSHPIKALQFRTKRYAWSLAIVSWLLAIGNSSQAIIYRKSLHYIHNSTFIGKPIQNMLYSQSRLH